MSHTIGQAKKDNQPSTPDRDSSPPEDTTSKSVSQLSDADYEFLFNQLLEGVAHGWHDRRVIKFFKQLGDRGQAANWVDWLERLRSKVIKLPIQSRRQLGTVMVRLGEITQSASEVKEIGAASHRIGRELLFGNLEDVVWEYAGPDLILEPPIIELETAEKISARLPQDFAELGSNPMEETEKEISREEPELLESSEEDLEEEEEFPFNEIFAESPEIEEEEEDNERKAIAELETSEELARSLAEVEYSSETPDILNTDRDEFEFELQTEFEPATEELIQAQENKLIIDSSPELSLKTESDNSPSAEQEILEEEEKDDPLAIDMDKLIHLIQEDEELAQEISEKLNILPVKSDNALEETPENSSLTTPVDLDSSSIDLIEGWFNLGLKQVSGGEFDKAIASWEKALNINPNLSEAWHNRGSALGRLGRYEEAVASFQKALAIDPENYQAWNDRAHALYQMQNWLAAAESWNNALKITPGNHLFWYNRGCALEQLENWAESIASYEKSLEIKPDFQPARIRYTNLIADHSRSN